MTPQEMQIIVVGGNGKWAKADTIEDAHKKAEKPRDYVAFVVHPDSVVTEDGMIWYPNFEFASYVPKKVFTSPGLRNVNHE